MRAVFELLSQAAVVEFVSNAAVQQTDSADVGQIGRVERRSAPRTYRHLHGQHLTVAHQDGCAIQILFSRGEMELLSGQ